MSSLVVPWDRLIRFVSASDGSIKYGEPLISDSDADNISVLASEGVLEARVLAGCDPLAVIATDKIERVARLLGPLDVENVPIIRCIGLNYKSHILETGRALPECPTLFFKPSTCIADCGGDIPIPRVAQAKCDYEGELVILIGKEAKDIAEDDALDFIAAYTCGDDISSRDWQSDPRMAGPVPQWCFSKSFDKYAPMGPCLVSRRLLHGADSLELRTLVNGQVRQQSNTRDLHFGVKKLVAFCSRGQTLQKGSLIMTGTPGGVGLFMKPPQFLQHGDIVTVEISGIGRLDHKIVFE